jgi:hypothetical protein
LKLRNWRTNIIRDLTPEEIAILKEDFDRRNDEAQAKREAALSKLAALGLTADDLRALGL